MRILFLFLLSVFLQVTAYSQSSERPEGIVLPVATLGDVTETRRQILQNTLIESLSSYYRLVPQDKLEEVQEKIFQEMDYDECTEDQCIVMIQEALQVENLFVLQVIGEGDDTQLSLKWVGLDDKKVKTDYCEDCGTKELNDRVEGLVRYLFVNDNTESTLIVESNKLQTSNSERVQTEKNFFKKNNQIRFDSNLIGNYEFTQKKTGIQKYIDSDSKAFNYYSFTFITSLNIGFGLSLIDLSFETNNVWDGSSYYKETTRTIDLSYLFYWDKFNLSFLIGFSYPFQNKIKVSTDSSRWEYEKKEYNLDGGGYFLNVGFPFENFEIFISRKEITNSADMFKNYYSSIYRGITRYRTYLKMNTIGIGYSF